MLLGRYLEKVRTISPLIHNITNHVTAYDCANITLACGASPIMAEELSEVEEITALSNALVINIGTLTEQRIPSMLAAGKIANERKLPVILDPVGVGASRLRADTVIKLLQNIQFTVIRGNKSEIKKVYDCWSKEYAKEDNTNERSARINENIAYEGSGISKENNTNENRERSQGNDTYVCSRKHPVNPNEVTSRGVDASVFDHMNEETLEESILLAHTLSRMTDAVIVITGEIDIVATNSRTYILRNGHPMMSKITGSGCMLDSLLGAFCGTKPLHYGEACAAAVCALGIAGELAGSKTSTRGEGTATFRIYLIDAISNMSGADLDQKAKVQLITGDEMEKQTDENREK